MYASFQILAIYNRLCVSATFAAVNVPLYSELALLENEFCVSATFAAVNVPPNTSKAGHFTSNNPRINNIPNKIDPIIFFAFHIRNRSNNMQGHVHQFFRIN